jgi:hypothetical protein
MWLDVSRNILFKRSGQRGDQEKGLVAVLEMTPSPQFPRDRVLWILANSGEKIERSCLSCHVRGIALVAFYVNSI